MPSLCAIANVKLSLAPPDLGRRRHYQFAEKLENGRAIRNIRIQSLMVANLSCVAQTGLESMLPIGTPRKPFSANCYRCCAGHTAALECQGRCTPQRFPR